MKSDVLMFEINPHFNSVNLKVSDSQSGKPSANCNATLFILIYRNQTGFFVF